jgi:hypothetical protein
MLAGLMLHFVLREHVSAYADFAKYLQTNFLAPLLERPAMPGVPAPVAPAPDILAPNALVDIAFACVWALLLGACTPFYNALVFVADRIAYLILGRPKQRLSFLERMNIRSIADQFERLLAMSVWHKSLIQVTLTNQKVYAGSVTRSVDPRSQEKYIRLLPFMSGFRSNSDGEVTYNTFYADLLERKVPAEVAGYKVIVPMDKVVTASGFDLKAYAAFSEARGKQPPPAPPRSEVTVTFGRPLRRS